MASDEKRKTELLEVEMLRDDERFGVHRGDVCVAVPDPSDPERLALEYRAQDAYGPLCHVFLDEVKILRTA